MPQRPLTRRTISIGLVFIGLPVLLALTPLWAIAAVAADVWSRLWRLPTLRLVAFAVVFLVHDWVGIIRAFWLWIRGSFGRRLDLERHRRVQAWWADSLLDWAGRLLGLRVDFDDISELPTATFILLSRHASMIDAVLPAQLVTRILDRPVHYALKRELQWDPSIDIYGIRLGNYFVARDNDGDHEARAIERMAVDAAPGSVLVIFPEGTYATPATRERVLASLRRNGDGAVVALAESMQTLLPPKPAGTLALVAGQPEADVVVVGHVGLEGVAELHGLRRRLPLRDPVVVRWWVHRRDELPTAEDELVDWLGTRWRELDRWVTDANRGRAG